MFDQDQQSNLLGVIPYTKIIGVFLIVLALLALGWVIFEVYQLYEYGQAFLLTDKLIPETILISTFEENGKLYLPREIFVYGVPLWVLGLGLQVGVALLRTGAQFVDQKNSQKT